MEGEFKGIIVKYTKSFSQQYSNITNYSEDEETGEAEFDIEYDSYLNQRVGKIKEHITIRAPAKVIGFIEKR